jgi:NAD(P)H dehydrogenase (quinone)
VVKEAFELRGDTVRFTDLYASKFDPVEHARHFSQRKDPDRFDALTEQRFSSEGRTLPTDVGRQVDDLLWADFLVLQFPLWWFGMPAMLKGWLDRVFAYGSLYTGSRRFHAGICSGKRARLSVTAGSSAEACAHDGREGDTPLILWPINYALHYVGFTVLEPAVVAGVRGYRGAEAIAQHRSLEEQLQSPRAWISTLDTVPIVPFNGADDWDERRKLKNDAPVYSPFIRHRAKLCLG